MKLRQILEDTQQINEQDIDQFAQRVKQDCLLYLNNKSVESNLFRGTSQQEPILLDRQLDEKRPGGFTDRNAVRMLHKLMQADGFKATRLNGYYAAPSVDYAGDFGKPFVLFPIGEYSLTWHEPTKDVPEDLGANEIIDIGIRVADEEIKSNQQAVRSFWEKYKHLFNYGQNVNQAVAADSEIVILTDKLHAIQFDLYQQYKERLTNHWYQS